MLDASELQPVQTDSGTDGGSGREEERARSPVGNQMQVQLETPGRRRRGIPLGLHAHDADKQSRSVCAFTLLLEPDRSSKHAKSVFESSPRHRDLQAATIPTSCSHATERRPPAHKAALSRPSRSRHRQRPRHQHAIAANPTLHPKAQHEWDYNPASRSMLALMRLAISCPNYSRVWKRRLQRPQRRARQASRQGAAASSLCTGQLGNTRCGCSTSLEPWSEA